MTWIWQKSMYSWFEVQDVYWQNDPHQTWWIWIWLLQCIRFGYTYAKYQLTSVCIFSCAQTPSCLRVRNLGFAGGCKHVCMHMACARGIVHFLCVIDSFTVYAVYVDVWVVYFDVYLFANLRTCSVHSGKMSFIPTNDDVQLKLKNTGNALCWRLSHVDGLSQSIISKKYKTERLR